MKQLYLIFIFLLFSEANPRPLKKDPAFAKPLYSNSYLPAAMQVIFYAVEQLKVVQTEETEQTTILTTTIPTTMSHEPGQHQPEPTVTSVQQSTTQKPILSQEASIVELETSNANESTPSSNHEIPEIGEETPEANYGTPETNHEMPEEIHETQEVNQENPQPEKDQVKPANSSSDKYQVSTTPTDEVDSSSGSQSSSSSSSSEEQKENEMKRRQPTVDSVVQEIYGIMKPQTDIKDSSAESESKESKEANDSGEEDEEDGDDNDENRFTLLGEKVSQVPRPSLSNYLRRSKIPPKCTIQQLALLYDALSKDARKQGFAKFSGYSDEVLRTLETSAEGGIGPQLEKLLERILERNEATRDDAKAKIAGMLNELNEPGSEVNRDLRGLLPLRFNP